MLTINSDYISSFSANASKAAVKKEISNIEKLSTGMRINSAKDDSAGLSLSIRLRAQIEEVKQLTKSPRMHKSDSIILMVC